MVGDEGELDTKMKNYREVKFLSFARPRISFRLLLLAIILHFTDYLYSKPWRHFTMLRR